jgi:hypothetical protein
VFEGNLGEKLLSLADTFLSSTNENGTAENKPSDFSSL